MIPSLEELVRVGVLSPLDLHLAKTLGRLSPGADELVLLAAALTSRAVGQGHVCADLANLGMLGAALGQEPPEKPPDFELGLPAAAEWTARLGASPLVAHEASSDDPRPLVLVGHRLYLYRYRRYEQELAANLVERAGRTMNVDDAVLRRSLRRLFTVGVADLDRQRLACAVAALLGFTVLSGGPGTGKTFTVTKLLAVLLEQARASAPSGARLRIVLLAPTGKAAQRLGESIRRSLAGLALDREIQDAIPTEASTIHRALGFRSGAPTRFRHDAKSPLPADVVLVDEASMVDVALMAKLCRAIPRAARLVLVGDKDQLASVEAGALLGDIYGDEGEGYSTELAERLERLTGDPMPRSASRTLRGVHDSRVHLTVSHRYGPESGIARLARAVNAGDADGALAALRGCPDLALRTLDDPKGLEARLSEVALAAFGTLREASPEQRLALLDWYRILCVHRKGRWGVVAVNAKVERSLRVQGVLPEGAEWYDGRPLLVTENDHQLELYNGDVGVMCTDDRGELAAYFQGRGAIRRILPARLPPHETVFAMTVHKSQGSEFDEILVLLPEKESPLLTRELLYTAITRARNRVEVIGSAGAVRAAVLARVSRASGLSTALRDRSS